MVIFFDLDGTLINTLLLKQYFVDFCVRRGLAESQAIACYETSRDNGLEVTFTVPHFLQMLHELYPEKPWPTVTELEAELVGHVELMPGALELIQSVSNEALYLLSLGQPSWQNWKLKTAELAHFFPPTRRLYTLTPQTGKRELVETAFGPDLKLFFNDHLEECRQLLSAGENYIVFLLAETTPRQLIDSYPEQLFVGKSLTALKDKYETFIQSYFRNNMIEPL